MSTLRIFCPLSAVPMACQWLALDGHADAQMSAGGLTQLPQGATKVELVLAASQVLLTRASVPPTRRRRSAALLAYAAEERLASDPDANLVSHLGQVDGEAVLAAVDRQRLQAWRDALEAIGIHVDGVYCATLLLPLRDGEWSFAWDGQEGFVRTGEFEGGATDCGDRQTPPLALHLLLEAARARTALPTAIVLHAATPAVQPDIAAWQGSLGVDIRLATEGDWRVAPAAAGTRIDRERRHWRPSTSALTSWRPIGWILLAALLLHSAALVADRVRLAGEQHQLRQQMEVRFRALFPAAVAVADPVLQTRRQLAQARHAANQPDAGDFPVMLDQVATALAVVPTAQLHALSYEEGRMTLEFTTSGAALARQVQDNLVHVGLAVEAAPVARRTPGSALVLTVRSR